MFCSPMISNDQIPLWLQIVTVIALHANLGSLFIYKEPEEWEFGQPRFAINIYLMDLAYIEDPSQMIILEIQNIGKLYMHTYTDFSQLLRDF